jgi:N-acetylneuraminic acid mutarotase
MKKIFTLLVFTFFISSLISVNAQYSWSQLTNFGGNARYGAVSFVIGDTAYVGLGRNGTSYFADFWKYNPSKETWTKIADFAGGARSNAVAFTLNNKGYVATGVNGSTKYKDLWEYNPQTNQWIKMADFGGTARSAAVAFTIGNKAYVGTGTDGTEKKDFWEYDPSANVWTGKASLTSDARQSASAFAINGKGYVCAGITYSSGTMMTNDVYEYNPVTNTWAEKSFAESHLARTGAATFVMNNKAYVCGGSGKKDLWEFVPATNTWTKLADVGLSSETNRHEPVAFSVKGKGFLTCGYYLFDFSNTYYKNDVWVYAPPQPPKAPSNMVATATSSEAVQLTWTNNSYDVTQIVVEKSIGDNQHYEVLSSSWPISTNNINSYGYNDSTTYYFRVKAVNSAGSSEYSNEDSATTRFEKPILSAIPYSTRSITLLWSHKTLRKLKYYIERSINDNTSFSLKDSVENIAEWSDTTLTDGTKYYYRLYVKMGNKKLYSNYNYAITGKQGAWKSFGNFPSYYSSCFAFMVGRKLYTGVRPDYNSLKIELYEYDADQNTWTKKSDFPGEYRQYPRAFMINSKGYIGGGHTWVNNQISYLNDFWEYDPAANAWKKITDFPGLGRQKGTVLTINNRGYFGLGYNQASLKDLWQYNPTDNSWSQMADCPVVLNNPTAFSIGNLGYFGFGYNTPLLYSFNPDLNQWTKKNDFNDLALDRSNSGSQFAFNIGEKAYLIASKINSFWEYNQPNDTWVRKNGYDNIRGPMGNNDHSVGSDGSIALFHPESENSPGSTSSGGSTYNFYLYDPGGISAPSNLRISESSKKVVQLKWFHDDPAVKFMIERYEDFKGWKIIDSTGINIKTYNDTTVKENTFYMFRISAKNSNKLSSYTNEVIFRSGPPALVPIKRVISKFKENSLTINFSPNLTNYADGYYLERSDELDPSVFVPIDTFAYTEKSFTDNNLEIGKWYSYRIKAYNKFGNTISKPVKGRPGDVCIFNGAITTDNATILDENGYDVDYYHCNTSKLTIYPQTIGNKISVVIDELNVYSNDTIYIYNGASITSPLLGKYTGKTVPDELFCGNNPDGCITILSKTNCSWSGGDYSGFKAIATSNKYFRPSQLKAAPSVTNIKIDWKDNSANEDYFIIERSVGDANHFAKLDSVPANTITYTDINANPTKQYFYRVRMKSGNEYTGYSNVQEAMILPASPGELTIKLNADGKLRLKWADNANNESGYVFYRSYNDSLHYFIIDTVDVNVDTFLFKPQSDYVYYYQVRAVNKGGLSAGSFSKPFIILKTPVLGYLNTINSTSVQLSWTDYSNAEVNYKVERSENDTLHFVAVADLPANSWQYTDATLVNNKNYYYRVKATHPKGESLYSVIKSKIYVTAVENLTSDLEISLYPNPASDIIYLKNEGKYEISQFRIFNSQGSMVMESGKRSSNDFETEIDVSGFLPGIYTLQVLVNGQTKNLRFIVQ